MFNSSMPTKTPEIPDIRKNYAILLKKEVERCARDLCFLGKEEEIDLFTHPSGKSGDFFIGFHTKSNWNKCIRVLITRDETAAIISDGLAVFPCGKHFKKLVKDVAEAVVSELYGITEQ